MSGFRSAESSFWRRFSCRAWIWRRGAVWKFERGLASAKAVSRSGSPPHSKLVALFLLWDLPDEHRVVFSGDFEEEGEGE
jgi:hypothetical protein